MLSARAGEEARVEGLAAGVDDYLIKPFNARELMARVSAAIELARVRREAAAAEERAASILRTQNERLALLWEAAGVLLSTEEPDLMLKGLFEKVSRHLGVDAYLHYLVDPAGDTLTLASSTGLPEGAASSMSRLKFGEALCGTVARTRTPLVAAHLDDAADPEAVPVKALGFRVYASNPLLAGDRLLGTLAFASRSRASLEPDEIAFIETLTQYVTVAYERLRLIGELRETDRRKDEFLATLAHELRNPLAPIRNGLQLLKLARGDVRVLEEARGVMDRQLRQMVRLIDDLLDVSRISRGKIRTPQGADRAGRGRGAAPSRRPGRSSRPRTTS